MAFTLWLRYCHCSHRCVLRTNDHSAESPLSWPLRIAQYTALTLIALATAVLLVVVLKESFGRGSSSSPARRRSESPLINQAWQRPGAPV